MSCPSASCVFATSGFLRRARRRAPGSGARDGLDGARETRMETGVLVWVGECGSLRSRLRGGNACVASRQMGTPRTGQSEREPIGRASARTGMEGTRVGGIGVAPRRVIGGAGERVKERARRCRLAEARRYGLGGAAEAGADPRVPGGFSQVVERSTGGYALAARRGSRMVVRQTNETRFLPRSTNLAR
jgi:hypothetical protein